LLGTLAIFERLAKQCLRPLRRFNARDFQV